MSQSIAMFMTGVPARLAAGAIATVLCVVFAADAQAQSAENVAVVVNEASSASQRIADHYIRARAIADANVIRIRTETTETIERAAFIRTIQEPIATAIRARSLHDRVLYIVLTKGIPLRIVGSEGADGTVASVDSELTLLYRRMIGASVAIPGRVANPYFIGEESMKRAERFTHRTHDTYLVSRLDAFTVNEALALIDRAQKPSRDGRIVLDQRGGVHRVQAGDSWLAGAAQRLIEMGQGDRVVLDGTTEPIRNVDNVLGYYSWGSNDPQNRVRRFGMRFVAGALAATYVSTDARTLESPPDAWVPSDDWSAQTALAGGSPQSLVGDVIREGATGVAGHVAEPYLQSTVRPEILFPAYLSGFNLVEAFYLAIPHLSWQTVVIGDPLCAPFREKALTREEIEEPMDAASEAPGLFAAKWIARARGELRGAPLEVAPLLLRAEERIVRGDRAGAIETLEEVTAKAPALLGTQLQLASMLDAADQRALASERYRIVLKTNPNNVAALNNLAYNLAVHQDAVAEALPLARRAVAIAPSDGAVLDTLGWIEHLTGNDKEAVRLLEQAVALSPAAPDLRLNAATVYAAIGDLVSAGKELAEALRLDPTLGTNPRVQQLRQQLKRR
jgi:uncharacterized protein (TIGR03790 family)